MKRKFKDHFSENSEEYNTFRPTYPKALFAYLASQTKQHQKAWDCATGTGQSAVVLSEYYSTVIATDASATQINNAKIMQGVSYQVATAENSGIEDNSIDLITVAQAFHWFNIEAFKKEANRVLKNNGIVSIWTYNLLSVQKEIDDQILYLYSTILDDYWPPERTMVEDGYKSIQLPFKQIVSPSFNMSAEWDLYQLIGYLNTWSATKKYQAKNGTNPVEDVYDKIADTWGDPSKKLSVTWPMSIRLWQKANGL